MYTLLNPPNDTLLLSDADMRDITFSFSLYTSEYMVMLNTVGSIYPIQMQSRSTRWLVGLVGSSPSMSSFGPTTIDIFPVLVRRNESKLVSSSSSHSNGTSAPVRYTVPLADPVFRISSVCSVSLFHSSLYCIKNRFISFNSC